MSQQLKPALQETLLVIHQLKASKKYMPTLREIATKLDLSLYATQMRVDKLSESGYLKIDPPASFRSTSRTMSFPKTIEYQGQSIPVLGTCD
jgi:SOS-response transcriptional repressor LexA